MLNTRSPLPLYHQLAEILTGEIRSGEYPPGTKIPPELRLAEEYGIGRPTARQAIDLLVRRGLVERKRGSGTYVCERKNVDLFSLAGTSAAFHRQGIEPETRLISKAALHSAISNNSSPFYESSAYVLKRLTSAENQPVLLEEIHLHPELFSGVEDVDFSHESLSRVASERFFMIPSGGSQDFSVVRVPEEKADLLGLSPWDPVLAVRRFLDFPQAEKAVYAEMLCRTDSFVFSQTLGAMNHE